MKHISKLLGLGLLILFATACGKDNYPEPNRQMKVKIISDTDNLPVLTRSSKSSNLSFNIVQVSDKWKNTGNDNGYPNNYGEINMKWYDGTYLCFPALGRGTWKSAIKDTIELIVTKNDQEFEYRVNPYYMFENVTYTLSGNVLSCTATIKEYNPIKISTIRLVSRNSPLICNVNADQYVNYTPIPTTFPATVNLSMTLSQVNMEKASTYARIMLQMSGKSDWQMGPHQKMR